MRALFSGVDRNGDRFSQILFATGGMGASPHRDGLSDHRRFPTNAGAGSIEAFESVAPLVVWRKQLRPDSGGAGPVSRRPRAGGRDRGALAGAAAALAALGPARSSGAGLLGGGDGAPA